MNVFARGLAQRMVTEQYPVSPMGHVILIEIFIPPFLFALVLKYPSKQLSFDAFGNLSFSYLFLRFGPYNLSRLSPSTGSAQVGARQGERGGGVVGSSSLTTSILSTSGLSPPALSFQTFCWIRVRSVWSVRSSACISRGGGAVQSRCGRWQSGHDHKFAMHGLQNQCSCSVLPQPRSCPRNGLLFSSFTSQQTPHRFPGRGFGASSSGILTRGIVCGTIGPQYGRECARTGVVRRGGWCDGSCLAVAACPCVWLVAWLCMLVMDEEVVIHTAVMGCLLCFLCVDLDAVL